MEWDGTGRRQSACERDETWASRERPVGLSVCCLVCCGQARQARQGRQGKAKRKKDHHPSRALPTSPGLGN